jgi:hypothetical protein
VLLKRSSTVILMLSAWLSASAVCRAADGLITLVDLMVVYTPEARNAAGGASAIAMRIQGAVREANLVFLNSGVDMRVRLVHAAEVQYPETWLVATDLARLRDSQDGFMDEVHAWRNEYQADLVCLIKERGADYEYYGLQGPSAGNAFSVLLRRSLTGDNYLPVTLSFNFGCQRDRPNANSVGAFPYSYGHVFSPPDGPAYGTVDALQFYRVPWFSNPEIRFQGMVCGIPAGKPFAADNSKTLNQTAQFISAFRGSLLRTRAPSISILSPSGSTGSPLSLIEDTNMTLRFGFSDSDGAVERIELFATADEERTQNFLAAVTNTDTLVLTNMAAGDYVIFAVAFDNMGASSRSSSNLVVSVQPRTPVNDNFADAIELTGTNIVVTGRTTSATLEPGEPRWGWPDWNSADVSVWYSWTAPVSGRMQMEVPGLQPVMGAVVGNAASNFTWIVINTSGWDGLYARIEFDVLAGTNYHFVVAGQEFKQFVLHLTVRPMLQVRIANPTNNARFTAGEPVLITAETYPVFTDSVTRVEFFVDGLPIGGSSDMPFSKIWTNETAGTHQITARAFDSQGRSNDSPAIHVLLAAANDNFENATSLAGTSIFFVGRNHGATLESDEPLHGGLQTLNSVWWRWTSPMSGRVTCSAFFPGTYPVLAVYTGDTLTDLNQVALAFNSTPWPGTSFETEAGVVYFLALATGYEGEFHLHLELTPSPMKNSLLESSVLVRSSVTVTSVTTEATSEVGEPTGFKEQSARLSNMPDANNDNFADRFVITTNSIIAGNNVDATNEVGELRLGGADGKTLWWTFTTPVRGALLISNTNPPPPLGPRGRPCLRCGPAFAIFTGDSITNLTMIASNTYYINNAPQPWIPLAECYRSVDAGTTCQIMVDSLNNGAWDFSLNFSFFTMPANDSFAEREVLSGTNVVVSTRNLAATLELDEPAHGSTNGGASVWWTWTAPERGMVSLEFVGPFSPLISVYTGGRLDELVRVPFYAQPLGFFAEAGITYQIAIDGEGGAQGIFDWSLVLNPAPTNDLFVNATRISGTTVPFNAKTDYASREMGEPVSDLGQAGSVWFAWKSPVNGHVFIEQHWIYSHCQVYVGTTVSNLMQVSVSPQEGFSAFYALAGITYHIAISDIGYGGDSDYVLRAPPMPPRFVPLPDALGSNLSVAFEIVGDLGQSFLIQASTNLIDWETIAIHTMQSNRAEFIDLSVAQYPARFFRILLLETLFIRSELKLGTPLAPGTAACSVPLFGPAGQPFVLRVSDNLSDWSELGRGWITGDRTDVADPGALEHPVRFYQALDIP